MNRRKSRIVFAISAAVSILAASILTFGPAVNQATAQILPIPVIERCGTRTPCLQPLPNIDVTVKKVDVLDREEIERRAREEQAGAPPKSPLGISFKNVSVPLCEGALGGIDHVAAGTGTRNAGFGTIRLRGVPAGSTIVGALLYWGEINTTTCPTVSFNNNIVTGALIDVEPQPCWNPQGTFFAYRANVSSLIAPGINGDYSFKTPCTSLKDGRCPWSDLNCSDACHSELPLSEGASLVVIYCNPCVDLKSQVIISEDDQTPPIASNFMACGSFSYTHIFGTPIAQLPWLKHTRIGADGQVSVRGPCGLASMPNITNEKTFFNGFQLKGPNLPGPGSPVNKDSDWNGYDGDPLNKLWDTHTDAMPNNIVGQLAYTIRYQVNGDCLVWVVHVLGVRG